MHIKTSVTAFPGYNLDPPPRTLFGLYKTRTFIFKIKYYSSPSESPSDLGLSVKQMNNILPKMFSRFQNNDFWQKKNFPEKLTQKNFPERLTHFRIFGATQNVSIFPGQLYGQIKAIIRSPLSVTVHFHSKWTSGFDPLERSLDAKLSIYRLLTNLSAAVCFGFSHIRVNNYEM